MIAPNGKPDTHGIPLAECDRSCDSSAASRTPRGRRPTGPPNCQTRTFTQALAAWLPDHLKPADADLWVIKAGADWDAAHDAAGRPFDVGGYGCGGRPHIAVVSYDLAAKFAHVRK
jgi:hypothetical protein